ncbi:hypothetical protein Clacol_001177 [Clathrus columnatus]|uniref:DUF7514 domain-containing protein n=1 Tax=Clathrus columnatus TaxID=1419009 RepID=A0AAV5A113_9AGAM|nr:hypothetical protein Clacol_001177 [Clathrus columnatus]
MTSQYTPIQYDNPLNQGQDLETFYRALLDPAGLPSQIFCRMSDAWFFYLDKNCPINPESGYIETEKLLWRTIAVGEKMDMTIASAVNLGSLRGFLHILVLEIQLDPEVAHKDWNRILNMFKLVDPMTGLHFPTPIPRSAFPAQKNEKLHAIHQQWQNDERTRLQADTTSTQPQPPVASGSGPVSTPVQLREYQQALQDEEGLVLRSQIMAARHRTRMRIIDNMGGGNWRLLFTSDKARVGPAFDLADLTKSLFWVNESPALHAQLRVHLKLAVTFPVSRTRTIKELEKTLLRQGYVTMVCQLLEVKS